MECCACRGNDREPVEATTRIWCPTWISADKGPAMFCDVCSRPFNCSDTGQFFYGESADREFESVEMFIPKSDERYINAKGMLDNVDRIFTKAYVVDGKAWLMNYFLITRLGDFADVKERMPKLFAYLR